MTIRPNFTRLRLLTAAGTALCLLACATIRTGSHYDESIDFGAYETFAWISDQPYILGDPSMPADPLTQTIIQDTIKREMELAGYRYTADLPLADLAVAYTIGTRDKLRVDAYPVRFRTAWGWHMPGSRIYIQEVSSHSYSIGTLGVDLFDNDTGQPIWHGYAEKTISQADRDDPRPSIHKGVAQLFASFPD